MSDTQAPEITAQPTPNPNSLQFLTNRELIEKGSFNFTSASEAASSGLAKKLFAFESVKGVLIGTQFVTITKSEDTSWNTIAEDIVTVLRDYLKSGDPVVDPSATAAEAAAGSETEMRIREILDNEIRPAVARDGGDIIFESYADGVVKLHLQGACSTCPSSVMTLKMGIESRLRNAIPEVKEVVSV